MIRRMSLDTGASIVPTGPSVEWGSGISRSLVGIEPILTQWKRGALSAARDRDAEARAWEIRISRVILAAWLAGLLRPDLGECVNPRGGPTHFGDGLVVFLQQG